MRTIIALALTILLMVGCAGMEFNPQQPITTQDIQWWIDWIAAQQGNLPIPPPKPPEEPVTPPEEPVVPPEPPITPPAPIPVPVPESAVVIDLNTFADKVRADFKISSRDSMIHAIWAAALYGWPIGPSGGADPEWDSYTNPEFYPKIQAYMYKIVDDMAARMKANPGLIVTGVTGDPNRPDYQDIDLQGEKYTRGVEKRLIQDGADMSRFQLGVFTAGSVRLERRDYADYAYYPVSGGVLALAGTNG